MPNRLGVPFLVVEIDGGGAGSHSNSTTSKSATHVTLHDFKKFTNDDHGDAIKMHFLTKFFFTAEFSHFFVTFFCQFGKLLSQNFLGSSKNVYYPVKQLWTI